jgi:ABC-type sugar transport system substrate-binding protein
MRKRTIVKCLAAGLSAAVVLATCAGANRSQRAGASSTSYRASGPRPSIWEIDPDESDPIFRVQDAEFRSAASVYHYKATLVGTPGISESQQITLINEARSGGAKAIIYCDADSKTFEKTVLAAERAGVVMITVDCVDDFSTYSIGQNLVKYGEQSAREVAKRAGPDAKVVMFAVDPSIPFTSIPYAAFVAYAKKHYPHMQMLAEEFDNGDPGTAATTIRSVIEGYPNVNAFWMDESASGPIIGSALQAAGKKRGQIYVLGLDALPGSLTQVKAGWITELLSQCSYYAVPFAAGLAVAKLEGHGLKTQTIDVPNQFVTHTNLPYRGCPPSLLPKPPS